MSLSEELKINLESRNWLVARLRAEIVGPDPQGVPQKFPQGGAPRSITWEEFRKPRIQANGEEVVWQDPPAKRYGAGVLFPLDVVDEREAVRAGEEEESRSDIDPGENQNVERETRKAGGAEGSKDYRGDG